MREIKFRAWDKDTCSMRSPDALRWCESVLISPAEGTCQELVDMYTGDIKDRPNLILMQFTNLLDKNGKEIYEGDIVSYLGFKGNFKIYWDTWGWRLKGSLPIEDREICGFGPILMPTGCFEYLEVIGNLYENPELLKTEKEANGLETIF